MATSSNPKAGACWFSGLEFIGLIRVYGVYRVRRVDRVYTVYRVYRVDGVHYRVDRVEGFIGFKGLIGFTLQGSEDLGILRFFRFRFERFKI